MSVQGYEPPVEVRGSSEDRLVTVLPWAFSVAGRQSQAVGLKLESLHQSMLEVRVPPHLPFSLLSADEVDQWGNLVVQPPLSSCRLQDPAAA